MGRRVAILILMLLLSVAGSVRGEEPPVSVPDFLSSFKHWRCADISRLCYANVPRLFFTNQPDTLLTTLAYWDDKCGPAEPITRALILGAIWDGDFSEDLYDQGMLDFLIWHADEDRRYNRRGMDKEDFFQGGGVKDVDLASGAETFDTFTSDLANQLLPHQAEGSLEQFFCLFYAGHRDTAWALLADKSLTGTLLQYDYDLEMEILNTPVVEREVLLTNGYWSPRGNLTRAGGKYSLGLQVGVRKRPWFARFVGEVRLGRADYPYYVDKEGVAGWSDRWDALSVGGEAGRNLLRHGRHHLDGFVGLGYDIVTPFQEEEVYIGAIVLDAGLGYRLRLGPHQGYLVTVDLRREWQYFNNLDSTDLDGPAWNVRLGLGLVLNRNQGTRRTELGQ